MKLPALLLLCPALAAAAPATLTLDLGGGVKMEFVRVEAGSFTQGSPDSEAGRKPEEVQRQVKISESFYMGKHPVTRAQWERFALEKSYRSEAETGTSGGFGLEGGNLVQKKEYTWRNPGFAQTPEHPVTMVTWFDAGEFVKWLGPRTGRQAVLPTEAQWEYACRAGTTTPWPTGSDAAAADAWAWHKGNSPNGTQPVGGKKANAWGLSDMGGQVWEWCQDWYGPWPAAAVTDPLQTNDRLSDKPRRVLRGGSFLKDAATARSASRFRNDPRSRNADNGFRVVALDRPPPPPPVKPAGTTTPVTRPPAPAPVNVPAPASPVEHHSSPPVKSPESGGGGFLWIILAAIAALVGWKFIKRLGSGGAVPAMQMPPVPGMTGSGAAPGTTLGRDGFWITGGMPRGTTVFWRWENGGFATEGQGAYEPGPEGMFIFTGQQPDAAHAWLAGDDAPQRDDDMFRRGTQAGVLMDQMERNRREQEREEAERRRRMADDNTWRHQSSSSSSSRHYPSAY